MLEDGLSWFNDSFLLSVVQSLMQVEDRHSNFSMAKLKQALHANEQLYKFLGEFRARKHRLSRFISRGMMLDLPGLYYFGGVFLGAGNRASSAFLPGIMRKLIENQNFVSWNSDRLATDGRYLSWSTLLMILNLVLLLLAPILVYLLWPW